MKALSPLARQHFRKSKELTGWGNQYEDALFRRGSEANIGRVGRTGGRIGE